VELEEVHEKNVLFKILEVKILNRFIFFIRKSI